MTEILQDARYVLRAFRSSPGLFAAIVVTLGVAVGGNATVFSWIEGVVLRPMAGVPDQDGVVAVAGIRQPGDPCCVFSYPASASDSWQQWLWPGSSRARFTA